MICYDDITVGLNTCLGCGKRQIFSAPDGYWNCVSCNALHTFDVDKKPMNVLKGKNNA